MREGKNGIGKGLYKNDFQLWDWLINQWIRIDVREKGKKVLLDVELESVLHKKCVHIGMDGWMDGLIKGIDWPKIPIN